MRFMATKKSSTLIIIFILGSLLSVSLAGGQRKLIDTNVLHLGSISKDSHTEFDKNKDAAVVHPRMLKVKTNDYGSYEPAPVFAKPPFKLINN